MKKGSISKIAALLLGLALVIPACTPKTTPSGSESSESSGGSSSEETAYTVSISNKSALQAAWPLNDGSRKVNLAVDPAANINDLIAEGKIVITSSDTSVLTISGQMAQPVAVGTARINVVCGESSDYVDVEITDKVVATIASIIEDKSASDAISFEGIYVGESPRMHQFWDATTHEKGLLVHPNVYVDDGTGGMLLYQVKNDEMEGIEVGDAVAVEATYSPFHGLPETSSQSASLTKLTDSTLTPRSVIEITNGTGEDLKTPALTVADVNRRVTLSGGVIKTKTVTEKSFNFDTETYETFKTKVFDFIVTVGADEEAKDYKLTIDEKYCGTHDELVAAQVGDSISCSTFVNNSDGTLSLNHGLNVEVKAPERPAIESIELASNKSEICVGMSAQLTVTPTPASASAAVSFSSSNESIATVDASGIVTAKALGTVTITATSSEDDDVTDTVELEVIAVPDYNKGSLLNPLTVEEVLYILDNYEKTSSAPIVLKGEVTESGAYTKYNNWDPIWLKNGENAKAFEVFRAVPGDGKSTYATTYAAQSAFVGKEIIVQGVVTLYNGSIYETNAGAKIVWTSDEAPFAQATSITLDKTEVELEQGSNVSFTPTLAPAGALGDVEWDVTPKEQGVTVDANGKVTAAGDATTGTYTVSAHIIGQEAPEATANATVTVVEASGGSQEQEHQATLAKGTGKVYDDITVNGNYAVKVGSSGDTGTATITIKDADAKSLSFYCAGWKGDTVTANISTSAGTVSQASISVTSDDSFTGSLQNCNVNTTTSEASYLVTLTLTGVTANTVITLTGGKASKCRFFVWNPTYVL